MMNSLIDRDGSSKEKFISELTTKKWPPKNIDRYKHDRSHWFSSENLNRIDNIIKMIYENTEGKKCLDVGVGTGLVLLREIKIFPKCIGLYIDIERALEKGIPKSILVEGNCYQMPFESEEFDLVSAYSLLHLLPNIPQFFTEAYKVLKKGGYLYTDGDKSIYNVKLLRKIKMAQYRFAGKKYKNKYKYWRDILSHRDKDDYHQVGLDFFELERVLKKIGFEKVILTPRFSVNPIHNKKFTFRIMEKVFHWCKLKSCFTHIQLFAIK